MRCFALRKGKCSILNVEKCESSGCSFYKTEVEVKEGRENAMARIRSLDKVTQNSISESYYGSKTPWLKGGV